MKGERLARAKSIFLDALDRPAAERGALLTESCNGDRELRDFVEELLRHHDSGMGAFLESPLPPNSSFTTGRERGESRSRGARPKRAQDGRALSHFEVLGQIGAGGMGVVYRAEDLNLRRTVALKLLPGGIPGSEHQEIRFEREARTAAALNHPNVCTVHEVGSIPEDTELSLEGHSVRIPAGSPFLAMEFIEGESLRDILKREGPLPLEKLLDLGAQISDGLTEAHARGIVHRDLKPGNVMVTPDGRAKILDFGLAKALRPETAATLGSTQAITQELTQAGRVIGTFSYMSPEQAEGRPVDVRTDVFAFGTLLYEIATGLNPFEAETSTATIAKILETVPRPLAESDTTLPQAFVEIVERCLRKAPEERYENAGAIAGALGELQDRVRSGARLKRAKKEGGPARRRLAVAATALLVLLAGSTVYRWIQGMDGGDSGPVVSESTVAIFPFTVRGAERFSYLSDGMVDLLGALLDGAGNLQSVDPFALATTMKSEDIGVPDPESGRGLAERLGAGLYVLGNIVEVGGHLQATCSLYEIGGAAPTVARASVDDESQLYELVEGLARQLLADRVSGEELGIDLAAETTRSITALKTYLHGERLYRAGEFDEAVAAYQQAVDADSLFALGWFALCNAANFTRQIERARDASARAMELRDVLPQRERYLVEAMDAYLNGAYDEAERLYQAVLGIHPSLARAWYGLAENHLHSADLRGRSRSEAWPMMQRALEEGMPRDHAALIGMYIWAAGAAGQYEEHVRWQRRHMELFPDSDWTPHSEVEIALLTDDERAWQRAWPEVVSKVRQLDDSMVWMSGSALWADFRSRLDSRIVGAIQQVHRVLTEPGGRSSEVRAAGHISLAHLELAKGRPAAARTELDRARALDPATTLESEALLAVGPVSTASPAELKQLRDTLLAWDAERVEPPVEPNPFLRPHDGWHSELRRYLLGLVSVRLGESDAAAGYAEDLDRSAGTPEETAVGAMLAQSIRTQMAVARGDSTAALDEFENMKFASRWELSGPVFSRALDRYLLAELLDAQGRSEEEALLWFEGVADASAYLGPSLRRRGEICEELGQIEEARQHYVRFLDLWQDCDPQYQPQVDEVRKRVEALAQT